MESGLMIPSALCGIYRTVKPRWRKVVKRCMADRNWSQLAADEMIDVANAPGALVLDGPFPGLQGENVLLYETMKELLDVTYLDFERRYQAYEISRDMMLDGLKHFWFCLGLLGGTGYWLMKTERNKLEHQQIARAVISAQLNFWDSFQFLDGKFSDSMRQPAPWPGWAHRPIFLCSSLGIDDEIVRDLRIKCLVDKQFTPDELAERLRKLVEA